MKKIPNIFRRDPTTWLGDVHPALQLIRQATTLE